MVTKYHNRPFQPNTSHRNLPSALDRLISLLPFEIAAQMRSFLGHFSSGHSSAQTSRAPRSLHQAQRNWASRRLLNLPHFFIAVWWLVLLWGERWVFQRSVNECRWDGWESWPKNATPHHLVFLADPQLIDPHSYPDRPWPLSTLTIMHTDNYLRRSYVLVQKKLHPDTLFFLGDLFDGGREWKTAHGSTEDPAWAQGQRPSNEQAHVATWGKRYGEDFWLKEYDRFGKIFYKYWNAGGAAPGKWQRGRRIISSLPGNHDLGLGANVKILIRNRFEVYFGEGNRVDVIGNHTFVSVDSVSLSARDEPQDTREITKPVEEFLANIQATKRKAVARELKFQAGEHSGIQYSHFVQDLSKVDFKNPPTLDPGSGSAEFPTILLTHVPLYRPPGTPCGRKREHWPPTKPPKNRLVPISPDDRNAISISRGWQYQNVLSEEDSVTLIKKIGNVKRVFSGDDHDYCEIVHRENKENVKEVTVKSMSWAMGVRKPGFVMMSMWNPIDSEGKPLGHERDPTTKTHLCLLPDQIGILIRYGVLVGITLLSLIIRAALTPAFNLTPFSSPAYNPSSSSSYELLPTTNSSAQKRSSSPYPNSSTSSSNNNNTTNLASRTSASRYGLPPHPAAQSRYPPPLSQSNNNGTSNSNWREEEEADKKSLNPAYKWERKKEQQPRIDTPAKLIWRETWQSIWRTTWVVVVLYFYFCWRG